MTWLCIRIFGSNSARLIVATAIIFAILPSETKIRAATSGSATTMASGPVSPFESFRRMLQPTPAPVEPQASALQVAQSTSATPQKRYRKRSRKARTPAKIEEEQTSRDDIASEQSVPVVQPQTPFVQIWPHVETGANENTQNTAIQSVDEMAPIAAKTDRLNSAAAPVPSDTAFVDPDEENDLDRAAAPQLQRVALASTDGAAPPDASERAVTLNRFSAFAESVKTIPEAPWFESILMVLAGVTAAFVAARIFVRAS